MSKILFWSNRLYVMGMVYLYGLIGVRWVRVQGVFLPFYPSIGYNTLRWIVNSKYETGEITLVKRYLQKTDRVLEIGTGLGFISSFCAKQVGSESVFTFEANIRNVKRAQRVFTKNGVQPVITHALLGKGEKVVSFSMNEDSLLASSNLLKGGEMIEVQQLDLNETIKKLQPTFLVLDIEGAEYELLKIIDFQSIRKVQIEVHPDLLGLEKVNELFSMFNRAGFKILDDFGDGRNYCLSR